MLHLLVQEILLAPIKSLVKKGVTGVFFTSLASKTAAMSSDERNSYLPP